MHPLFSFNSRHGCPLFLYAATTFAFHLQQLLLESSLILATACGFNGLMQLVEQTLLLVLVLHMAKVGCGYPNIPNVLRKLVFGLEVHL